MTRQRSPITRSGARRLGDEYQDLVALEMLLDWLEHSDRYQWIRVEADEAGFLDDVIALHRDGRLTVRQVKFATDPDSSSSAWTWDDLLATSAGKAETPTASLIQKWASSLIKLQKEWAALDAAVLTNRGLASDVAAALDLDNRLYIDRLAPDVRTRVLAQFSDETTARAFFASFRFLINQPNLHALEQGGLRRFQRLGGTDAGWKSLKHEMRRWVIYRNDPQPDGRIRMTDVRQAALWHYLEPLDQRFVIPDDYVLPSAEFHEQIIERLQAASTRHVVLAAPPGLGKSTYMSFLFEALANDGVPVIRHHYFLALNDRASSERLNHRRAAESLMSDLIRRHAASLGELASRNAQPSELRAWLEACGTYYAAQGKHLILLLDGLDHVWRAKRSIEELDELLGHLIPSPSGVVLLLATQAVDDTKLPENLLRFVPRAEWLALPRLDDSAVGRWLRHHEKDLAGPGAQSIPTHIFERLTKAFYRRTAGHPLHLRYTLKALQERNMPVTVGNIRALPACPDDDITKYYAALWRALPEPSRAILTLLAACPFPWPPGGIVSCLDPTGSRIDQIRDALNQVEHLLTQDALGLGPFHASLLAFVNDHADQITYSQPQKRHALDWLRTEAPPHWRWAYEWALAADLGDEQSLLDGPDRAWAIRAVATRRTSGEIEAILSRSLGGALRHQDLPRAVTIGLLREYVHGALHYDTEVLEALLYPQLLVTTPDEMLRERLHVQIADLTDAEVALLAEADVRTSNEVLKQQCLAELRDRVRNHRTRSGLGRQTAWRSQVTPILQVAAQPGGPAPENILKFAAINRSNGYTAGMVSIYANLLRTARNMRAMRDAMNSAGSRSRRSEKHTAEVSQPHNDAALSVDATGEQEAEHSHSGSAVETSHIEYAEGAVDRFSDWSAGSRSEQPFADLASTDESGQVDTKAHAQEEHNLQDEDDILRPEECAGLVRHAVLLALEEGIDLTDELAQVPGTESNAFAALYAAERAQRLAYSATIVFPPADLVALKRYEEFQRAPEMRDFFIQVFFSLLATHRINARAEAAEWLRTIDHYTWARRLVQHLDGVAAAVASRLSATAPISLEWFYQRLDQFPIPSAGDADSDGAALAYHRAAIEAATEIGFDLLILAAHGATPTISVRDLEVVLASPYCDTQTWMQALITCRRAWLADDALARLFQKLTDELVLTVTPFSERAACFARLGSLAALHGRRDQAEHYILEAATNLLAHGYHKDLLLDNAMTSIQRYCEAYLAGQAGEDDDQQGEATDSMPRNCLLRLAPAVAYVTQYTDGDETHHLPTLLADVLPTAAPDLLAPYYIWLDAREDYEDARHALHAFLRSADLSDPVAQAIAGTAIDEQSVAILSTRSGHGNLGAQDALARLEQILGSSAIRQAITNGSPLPDKVSSDVEQDRRDQDGNLSPADYPPERFDEYVAGSSHGPWTRESTLETWITHWAGQGRTRDVLAKLEEAAERGIDLYHYDLVFDLALSYYGKETAYPWLVRAHIESYGWQRFMYPHSIAERRWEHVRTRYPSRWFRFIADTISEGRPWPGLTIGHGMWVPLVEYAIFMGQRELAKHLIGHMVDGALELVSPLALPTPDWTHKALDSEIQ